jgi:ribosome biogenesis GTPase
MASEEDKQRQLARFRKQMRHLTSRDEELQRKQQAKARRAQQPKRQRDEWSEDDAGETFAKMRRAAATPRAGGARAVPDDLPRATVTAVHHARVDLDFAPARVAPRLLLDPRFRLVVGDEVAFERTDGPARVVALLPRRSFLARPDPGNAHKELLLAANVDVAVIVASVQDPPLRPGLIDRFLLALQRGSVAPLLCVNKVDLLDDAGRAALAAMLLPYVEQSVPVLHCSASTGQGVDELRAQLRARTCVFVGHSGVGKSSLLNAIDPEGGRSVGSVRAGDGRGRHTTAASSLRQLGDGTRVIDTPGIRAFGFDRLSVQELRDGFPELLPFAAGCRFADCTHAHEPACAVRAAVAAGQLSAVRFGSYLRLLAGMDE